MTESLDYVKTELMPDFDFDAFNHEFDPENPPQYPNTYSGVTSETPSSTISAAITMNEDEVNSSVSNETPTTESTELNDSNVSTASIEPTIAPETSGDNLSGEEVDKW